MIERGPAAHEIVAFGDELNGLYAIPLWTILT